MEAAVRLGYTDSACTDVPCVWNECFTSNVQPALISDIKFFMEASKERVRKSKRAAKTAFTPATHDEQDNFIQALATVDENIVGLSAEINQCADRFQGFGQTPSHQKIPVPLRSFYKESNSTLSDPTLAAVCDQTVTNLKLSDEEIKQVEEVTRNQSQSMVWHEQRAGRITSVAGDFTL